MTDSSPAVSSRAAAEEKLADSLVEQLEEALTALATAYARERARAAALVAEGAELRAEAVRVQPVLGALREQLEAAALRYEAEQRSASLRYETFARSSLEDKRRLQGQLDSTRQLLTHLKLTLGETQREVEDLRVRAAASATTGAVSVAAASLTPSAETATKARGSELERVVGELAAERAASAELRQQLAVAAVELTSLRAALTELREQATDNAVVQAKEREMHFGALRKRDAALEAAEARAREAEAAAEQARAEGDAARRDSAEASGAAAREAEVRIAELEAALQAATEAAASAGRNEIEAIDTATALRAELARTVEATGATRAKETEAAALAARVAAGAVATAEASAALAEDAAAAARAEVERERARADRCAAGEDRLSRELAQLRERQGTLLCEERELFHRKIAQLQVEATQARAARDQAARGELERATRTVLELQGDVGRLEAEAAAAREAAASALASREHALEVARRAEVAVAAASKAAQDAARVAAAELEGKVAAVEAREAAVAARVQRAALQLERVAKVQSAIECDLACKQCCELVQQPVLALPKELRCCAKCLPVSVEADSSQVIFPDAAFALLSTKALNLRHAVQGLHRELMAENRPL
jgi:hypothetical protein